MQLESKPDIMSSGFQFGRGFYQPQNALEFENSSIKPRLINKNKGKFRLLYLPEKRSYYFLLKSIIDTFLASVMLVMAAPLMLATYLAIKVVSPGPALLKQKRLTLNGKQFTIYKYRSMRLDAEKRSGAKMADENDPRIFPLGKFLRKARLDELPQLINVIKGEMSLVGPRPERPEIASTLEKELRGFYRRTRTKAGLTGLAQVQHGYCSSIDSYRRKLALDLLYVRKQSLLLDIAILFKTISVILFFRGAR